MKTTLHLAFILTCAATVSTSGQDLFSSSQPTGAPDKQKVSYALGMNLGMQLKRSGADVDVDTIAQGLHDVLEGKPTKLKESELRDIFMQAQAFTTAKKTEKNRTEGEAYLAKNAKAPGVTVLPDGMQYRVIKDGLGEMPQKTSQLIINYRGTWVDGTEFKHANNFQLPMSACPAPWQEALLKMKVGSKWEIYVPGSLAYSRVRETVPGYGTALIYDLELVADQIDPSHPTEMYGGGRMGHSPDEEFLPAQPREAKQ